MSTSRSEDNGGEPLASTSNVGHPEEDYMSKLYDRFVAGSKKPLKTGKENWSETLPDCTLPKLEQEVFVFYAWKKMLQNYLREGARVRENISKEIVKMANKTIGAAENEDIFDTDLIQKYIKKINASNHAMERNYKDNWYDLPATIRAIAPESTIIENVNLARAKEWMQLVMKGLPHSIIMAPLNLFKLRKKIRGIEKSADKVSTRLRRK